MKSLRFSAFAVAALILTTFSRPAHAADAFEGKVSITISSADSKSGPRSISYSLKNGLARIDATGAKGESATIIFDSSKQEMMILIPQRQMYMVHPMGGTPGPAESQPTKTGVPPSMTDTGETTTILGYLCKHLKSTDGTTDLWVTDQLGTFQGLGQGAGPAMRNRQGAGSNSGWESSLKGAAIFPMRVVVTSNGTEKQRFEVTAVSKENLPDSDFAPPAGWNRLDMGAMMQGIPSGAIPGMPAGASPH